MFRFGARSQHHLRTCHPDLQRVLRRALGWGILDFAVLDGHRGEARQEEYFRAGCSKARWPDGAHNAFPADAVDVAPWIGGDIPWEASCYWYQLGGIILAAAAVEDVPLRWGADFNMNRDLLDQAFKDLGHFERRER